MLRQMFVASVVAVAAVAGSAGAGHAGVSVDLGIHLGSPPQFAQVPDTPVSYAPAVGANLFLYDGQLFDFRGGVWLVSPGYRGPWVEVPPHYVPRPILAVPVKYYRVPPREWAHWRRDAPPRWAPSWGHRWEERHHAHPGYYGSGHRGERHAAYRDDRVRAYRDEHRSWRYDGRR